MEDLKKEIRLIKEELKSIKYREIKKITLEKVTERIDTINLKLEKFDLKLISRNEPAFYLGGELFRIFLDDILSKITETSETNVTYHWHFCTEFVYDNIVWREIGQKIIDLNTIEGCIEACNRLNYIHTEIKKQLKDNPEVFLRSEKKCSIGIFKLKSNDVIIVNMRYFGAFNRWAFHAVKENGNYDGMRLLSDSIGF